MLIQGVPVYCAPLCGPISAMYLKPAWRVRERGIMYNRATKSRHLYKQKENERK